jgi:GNAT superfamily N-acetyltransferase
VIEEVAAGSARVDVWLDLRNRAYPWHLMDRRGFERSAATGPRRVAVLAEGAGVAWVQTRTMAADHPCAPAGVLVLPERRRRGIGTQLDRAISDQARRWGVRELEVLVHSDDPDGAAFARSRG